MDVYIRKVLFTRSKSYLLVKSTVIMWFKQTFKSINVLNIVSSSSANYSYELYLMKFHTFAELSLRGTYYSVLRSDRPTFCTFTPTKDSTKTCLLLTTFCSVHIRQLLVRTLALNHSPCETLFAFS